MRRAATLLLIGLLGACSCGDEPIPLQMCDCAPKQLCQEQQCRPACEAGFAWDGAACIVSETATCRPLPAAGSIRMRCEMEHRECLEPVSGQATCGACSEGFLEIDGACEARRTCSELMCSAQNRNCEPSPNGRCTGCIDGFVEDGASCRAPRTCAETMCMPGFTCVMQAGMDATCQLGGCGMGEVPRANGGGCVRCFLDCAGRPGATGQVYQTSATLADTCVCETTPGWFWDEGAGGGGDVRACDADGDGWVRVTAKRAIDRVADRAISANARCDLRTVDRVRLANDEGQSSEVMLPAAASLYEPERLDDPQLLADAIAQGTLPLLGGRAARADELNTLTKACVWKATAEQQADFNQNGIEDVDEAHLDPRLDDPADALSALYDFTYFVELSRGAYVEGAAPGAPGVYVIAEKSRDRAEPDPGRQLALTNDAADGGDHWRTCERRRDAGFVPAQPGFDFGVHDAPDTWNGMGHSSQFRCVRIVAQPTGRPHELGAADVSSQWTLNACTAGITHPPLTAGLPNPSDADLDCAPVVVPDPRTSTTAPVLFAVSKYIPYSDRFSVEREQSYVRGCINECAVHAARCPGYDPVLIGAQCVGNHDDFGSLGCGCARGFAGPGCSLSCPGDLEISPTGVGHLFTSSTLGLVPRTGTWLCGAVTSGGGDALVGTAAGSTTTWSIRGDVPTPQQIPTTELCAPGPNGCTIRVRASTP